MANGESNIKSRGNQNDFSALFFLILTKKGALKMGKYSYLTFDQRREIESLYNDGNRVVDIASKIQRSVAAVYEELKRGYTGELDENKRLKYNADLAQTTVHANIRRRGNKQLNKSAFTNT